MILGHSRRLHLRIGRVRYLSHFPYAHEACYRFFLMVTWSGCIWIMLHVDRVNNWLYARILHFTHATCATTEGLGWLVACNQAADGLLYGGLLRITYSWRLSWLLTGMWSDHVYGVMILVVGCIFSRIERAWKVGLTLVWLSSFHWRLKFLPVLLQLLTDPMLQSLVIKSHFFFFLLFLSLFFFYLLLKF